MPLICRYTHGCYRNSPRKKGQASLKKFLSLIASIVCVSGMSISLQQRANICQDLVGFKVGTINSTLTSVHYLLIQVYVLYLDRRHPSISPS
ncbi:hypothetical protein HD806DRAFT_476609 [Xylariaceae sp. AK1471]|nr:hypothetical protein HD806DRAFT_476609 [Xylariaceae sp. AK1471]